MYSSLECMQYYSVACGREGGPQEQGKRFLKDTRGESGVGPFLQHRVRCVRFMSRLLLFCF